MKRLLIAVLLFCSCCCATADISRYVMKDAASRNVLVMDKTTPESDRYCSGVIIGPDLVLTAGHCWAEKLVVNGVPATVLKKSEEPDLMLLSVHTSKSALVVGDPEVGDQVVSAANRAPYIGLLNFGRVARVDDQILIAMLAVPGFSGSGVYGADGRLVGMVIGSKTASTVYGEIPMYCIAIKGSDIRKFIES